MKPIRFFFLLIVKIIKIIIKSIKFRVNLHKRGKTVCPQPQLSITEHFNSCCKRQVLQRIQVIEVLSGNSCDENGIMDGNICRLRLGREDLWRKTSRIDFPYGLNERTKDLIPGAPTNFCPIEKSGERSNRWHNNRNSRHSKVSLRNFLNFFKDQIARESKDTF